MTRYVIVGGGPAGVHAAITIRSHDPNGSILLLHGEPDLPYHRLELDAVIGGSYVEEHLPLYSNAWYQEQAIDLRLDSHVTGLSPSTNTINLHTGQTVEYDVLLLATGSQPVMGEWPGHDLNGVMTLRTWGDARSIIERVKKSKDSIVVVGGGVLGLTLAESLRPYADRLIVIEQDRHVWNSVLDQKASEFIVKEATRKGIEILVGEQIKEIKGDTEGVREVCTSKNRSLKTSIVVVAMGVHPAFKFLDGSGIRIDRGILIDHEFRTNVENIYAAGDVAQGYDPLSGMFRVVTNWSNAVEQGQLAGASMTGQSLMYHGVMTAYTETLFGIPVMMAGSPSLRNKKVNIFIGENGEKGMYRKIVLKEGKIVGALFLGNVTGGGMIRHYIRERKAMTPLEVKSTFLTGLVIGEQGRS